MNEGSRIEIRALKTRQWLAEWDKVAFDESAHRKRPAPHFYMFSIDAADLKALTGIYRRSTEMGLPRSQDFGIQRRHEPERSQKIRDFVKYGFPWSELSANSRKSDRYDNLRKPGWLPTAVVVNILRDEDRRRRLFVAENDLVGVQDIDEHTAIIKLPLGFKGSDWRPQQLSPIEVIDGQHRLWAFEDEAQQEHFELPVVAFFSLDISWQAYLFWTINITPKRINASLAYDLYPLLRTEDWLERFEGPAVYRETRAQELTEALWAHPESPWYQKINMLGDKMLGGRRQKWVSQAAWIRSLMATYIKAWESPRSRIGGLFGAKLGQDEEVLPWTRAQQAAFLILMGRAVRDALAGCQEDWAQQLRAKKVLPLVPGTDDPAFYGEFTLLNTDQGIRGMLYVINDLCFVIWKELQLDQWTDDEQHGTASDKEAVSAALRTLEGQPAVAFLKEVAAALSKYDWRTSAAPGLSEAERTLRGTFRGSSGYRELRRQLLVHLSTAPGEVGRAAKLVVAAVAHK